MFLQTESPRPGGLTRARVLIATADQGLRSQLVSLVQSLGYELVTTHTAGGSLASAQVSPPDAAILDHTLPDAFMSGVDLCRQLQPQIGPGTPLLVMLPADAEPGARRAALRAGAWCVLARPIDASEFRSRLQTYMEARLHQQRAGSEGLVDPVTGLYNPRGVGRWARELGALAYRRRAPLACLAIAPTPAGEERSDDDWAVSRLAEVLRTVSRGGDVIGRLGRTEFVVLAPETNAAGVIRYAERLATAVQRAGEHPPALRIGYDAVENVHGTPTDAIEMVGHASRALRRAQSTPGPWIRSFDAKSRPPVPTA